jgi:hypothetical protein
MDYLHAIAPSNNDGVAKLDLHKLSEVAQSCGLKVTMVLAYSQVEVGTPVCPKCHLALPCPFEDHIAP